MTHMPPEQIASLARQSSPELACEASLLGALREHGPQAAATLTDGGRLGIVGSRSMRRSCLKRLLADGLLVETGAGPTRRIGAV